MPTNAHSHSKSEKSIDLFKSAWKKAWQDHPELSTSSAVRLAFIARNARIMPAYKLTSKSVHLGRNLPNIPDLMPDFAFSVSPLSPSLKDGELFFDAADKTRSRKKQY